MIRVDKNRIQVETKTLSARFEKGALVKLERKRDGRVMLEGGGERSAPLELVYAGEEGVALNGMPDDRVICLPVSEQCAEMRFEGWNGEGVIAISEDVESGDLVVEPSGCASRPGLRSVRWNVQGIGQGLDLVAPFFQGVQLPLEDVLIRNTRWKWPFQWEAGMAILQGEDGGFWVHCRDDRYRYKGVKVGTEEEARCLGLETEAYGPLHDSLSAGGLCWRVNVHDGDWREPAGVYRNWLAEANGVPEKPGWLKELRFAVSWCPVDEEILDALAERLEPERVLLHLPQWRTDGYDENYPTYEASERGRDFIGRARERGFRAMPHFNSIDMDPIHPAYAQVRDFQYRDLESQRLQGWTWAEGKGLPLQEGNGARLRHRDKKTMIKVHPGLGVWRSILTERVRQAAEELELELAFLDVTLCTWNLHNCLVENVTPTEGMKRLIERIAGVGNGLVVGGEGRNEITMQGQGVSQVHLFHSFHESLEGLGRTAGCPLNEFLFEPWGRSFGYSNLGGQNEVQEERMRVHVSLGAMPTVTIRSAEDIAKPNTAVEEMLKMAAG